MKKQTAIVASLLAIVAWHMPAQAADRYFSVMGGASWMSDLEANGSYGETEYSTYADAEYASKTKSVDWADTYGVDTPNLTILGVYGCDYGSFRVEAELGYQTADIESNVNNEHKVIKKNTGPA